MIFDAVVLGAGPSGCAAATALARAGRSVLLVDRDPEPRFKIGESLLPWNLPLFEELGLMEKIEAAGFQRKFGALFTNEATGGTRQVARPRRSLLQPDDAFPVRARAPIRAAARAGAARFDRLTGPAGLTRSVESSRASARSRATVFPVPGTTRRAATSARGTRTNRRDAIRGCGTVRRRVAICSLS
jgi:Tryptophan halogenase